MLKFREFVKKIRDCKTADEERSLVNKESAEIRNLSKDQAESLKIRSLSKCVFMTLLGYHTEFIHMTCLGLLASSSLHEKRLAYVGITVFLDENSEVLLLTSHTIKKDLESPNQFIVAAALNTIGEICTADMCRDSAANVLKCLSNSNPYIKKKAALVLTKIISKCPELVDTVAEKLNLVFEDKNHGVLLGGLALANKIFKTDQRYITKNKKYIGTVMKLLKTLNNTNYAPEFDIHGITDPFLQVKLLEVLAYFGTIYKDENEELNNLLASMSTNTDASRNTGNAVLYELVRTVLAINSDSGLKVLASNILGKFLSSKDNNYKYIALNTLREVARTDINSVQKHKTIIVECLHDPDMSIKRRSLDLIYIIVNSSNIKSIVKECLNFLLVDENEFKLELTTKITQSLAMYSPSLKWEIDTLIKMLCLAGGFISDDTLYSITNLIIKVKELHKYSMFKLFIAMRSNLGQEGLVKVGVYSLGELFNEVIDQSVTVDDETISINEETIISLIDEINSMKCSLILKGLLVSCYFKIIPHCSERLAQHFKELLEQETKNFDCEIQQRATEYVIFLNNASDDLKRQVISTIPINKTAVIENQIEKQIIVEEFEGEEDNAFRRLIGEDNGKIAYGAGEIMKKDKKENSDFTGDLFSNQGAGSGIGMSSNTNQGMTANDQNLFDIFGGSANPSSNTNDNNNMMNQKQMNNQPSQQPIDLLSQLNELYVSPSIPSNTNINTDLNQPIQSIFNSDLFPSTFPQAIPSENVPYQNPSLNTNFSMATIISDPQTFNLSQFPTSTPSSIPTSSTPIKSMKEIYKNSDVSIYSDISILNNKGTGAIYISSNTLSSISNLKLNFQVRKHITFKVISTSGNSLIPNQSLGIKKEITLINNEPDKDIDIKMALAYTIEGKDITTSFMHKEASQ